NWGGIYAGMFHVKHRASCPKTRICKTTPCIKKSSHYFNYLTLRRFGTSGIASAREAGCPSAPPAPQSRNPHDRFLKVLCQWSIRAPGAVIRGLANGNWDISGRGGAARRRPAAVVGRREPGGVANARHRTQQGGGRGRPVRGLAAAHQSPERHP